MGEGSLTGGGVGIRPCERITIEDVDAAILNIKDNEAAGPSWVATDMIKAAEKQAYSVQWIYVISL